MKVLIIGATGNTGGTLVKIAMAEGHEVTAVVRSREKFEAQLKRCGQPQPNTLIADAKDFSAIRDACSGQDVVINTAGNVTDGEQFVQLFHGVVDAVEAGLGPGQRFWAFAGAAALDVPGSNTMTVSLPKVPAMFRAHAQNFDRLKASSLSWSMLCPGPMITSKDGQSHTGLRLSADSWPVPRPEITRYLPRIATALAFKSAMPELTICYEDAARVILDNLAPSGPFVKRRVGIALPKGVKQSKDLSELSD